MPQLQLIASPQAHAEPAWSVAFNPKRNLLASCSTDKTVRLYSYSLPSDDTTHKHGPGCSHSHSDAPAVAGPSFPAPTSDKPIIHYVKSLQTEQKRTIRSLAWAPSGRTLATGSFDSTVAVWEEMDGDGEGGEEEEAEEEGQEGVYKPKATKSAEADQFMDDEDKDGPEGGAKAVKEWECVTTLEGHESECKAVGWSSDGALLASCSRDKSVWVWEVQPDSDFECIAVMMEHTQDVKTLAWHTSEEILASASYDSHIHLQWDDPDGDWCIFQKLHPKLPAIAIAVPRPDASNPSPPASEILAYNSLVSALLPTAAEREAEAHLNVPPLLEDETVWSLAWSPCGRFLASGGDLGGIRIWARTGNNPDSLLAEIYHTAAHSRSCFSLSWTTGGSATSTGGLGILASAGADGKIIVWQISDLKDKDEVPESASKSRKPQIAVTPVAAVRDAHGVADVNCVTWLQREDGAGAGVLASCADDGSVKVWRVVSDAE